MNKNVCILSTHITDLFDQVDVIALVDNLKSPLQAASHAVLDTVTHSGHAAKLLIAFTHFEMIGGRTALIENLV